MKLTSPAFADKNEVPIKYTCDGENITPPLHVEDVPKEAKSLALVMDDSDAPGGTFVHWVIFNFSPSTVEIEEGNLPTDAAVGRNSADETGYTSPCPPSGTHRYRFKLFALNTSLSLQFPNAEELYNAMDGNVIAKAELTGIYSRKTQ